jgi:hypothetical protein
MLPATAIPDDPRLLHSARRSDSLPTTSDRRLRHQPLANTEHSPRSAYFTWPYKVSPAAPPCITKSLSNNHQSTPLTHHKIELPHMDVRHSFLHLLRKLHAPRRPTAPPIHSSRRRHARVPMHNPPLQSCRGQGLHEEGPSSGASEEFPSHGYSETEAWGEVSVSVWVA